MNVISWSADTTQTTFIVYHMFETTREKQYFSMMLPSFCGSLHWGFAEEGLIL